MVDNPEPTKEVLVSIFESRRRRRRTRLMIGFGVVLLVLLIGVGGVLVWRQVASPGAPGAPNFLEQLSLSEDGTQEQGSAAEPSPIASPVGTSLTPLSVGNRQPQKSLAVTIQYVRSNQFDLSIAEVSRTWEIPTTLLSAATPDNLYSVLEMYDGTNTKISEHKFSMPTTVALEGEGGGEPYALPESELDIVMSVPDGSLPTRLRIVTDRGVVLDERSFVYEALPEVVPVPSTISRLRRSLVAPVARAAEEDLSLVVINDEGANAYLGRLVGETRSMINNIDPWKTYRDAAKVSSVVTSEDLGCDIVTLPSGNFPVCPNSGRVIRVVQEKQPDWDGIVVVTTVACNCGTSFFGSHITAVGISTSRGVIAHEFGHGIASLADEYYYQFNGNGPGGPNCFASEAKCQEAIAPYKSNPDARCSLGCNNTSTYRPASRIMHNEYTKLVYGPVEECLFGHRLASLTNRAHTCPIDSPTPTPTPTPIQNPNPPPNSGTYYGGGR